ncbi:Hpt domain-containing protein [Vibrio salinus]|uniref:Hpt domain-containing protein n=1 Tax=Vibrio salinus TaxID=2899784 RepID=UPI001E64E39E|nr:Hpt domain-containing protein [Vibrio salinus]MCE0496172.1 Hpt domain-containing protein [Vibrio salinus]
MVGDENISSMLENYMESIHPSLDEFKKGWQNSDSKKIRMLAHKMKSSSRFIGATNLAKRLEFIELNGRQDDAEKEYSYESLLTEFSDLLTEIESYLSEDK